MSRQKVQYGTSSDYSEGLMGEIQRLIAPPNEEYRKKPPNPFKRAGRQNHDTCDACAEAGNLLCCDFCTASFHLSCHDPPLEEKDIPMGLWLCHTCTMKEKIAKDKEEQEKQNAKETEIIQQETKENVESPPVNIISEIKDEASEVTIESTEIITSESTTPSTDSSEAMQIEDEASKDEKIETVEIAKTDETQEPINVEKADKPEELSPFEELIRAASLLNPKQFELPSDMTEPFPFPGTERVEPIRNGRRVKNKRLIELDSHGCVALPAKLCFSCNKSCKKAPLIACDYCTLFFHQDCLNPPMTALPAGRWMCPNHPQQFTDWHLISSISATERMKVWDKFGTDPIDHEVVKLQFFRKVHTQNPPFRTKLQPKPRDEVEIPEIIRHHYKNPPKLLPSLRDVVRIDNLRKRGTVRVDFPSDDISVVDDDLEALGNARKRLKMIFNDQEDIHGLLVEPEKEEEDDELIEKLNKSKDSIKKNKRCKSIAKELDLSFDEIKIEIDESDVRKDDGVAMENISSTSELSNTDTTKEMEVKQEALEFVENKNRSDQNLSILQPSEIQSINEQLANLDTETIKLLAFQRFQQIVNENPNLIQKFQDKSVASQTVVEVAKWDVHRFPIPLANDTKNRECDEKPIIRMREQPFHLRTDSDKAHSVALSLENSINKSKVRSRAVLTFANDYLSGRVWFSVAPSLNLSIYMRYRSFSIGIGADNDLDLSRFGSCAFASSKHAVIFYDDVTKQYELLNYSEFGSEVNGQLYCCDFSEHPTSICETPTSPLKDKRVAIQSKIKNMLDAKKKIREGVETSKIDDIKMSAKEFAQCECKLRCPMVAGWEGTALLQHGYLLKFGCLSFVFSIAEYDSGNDSES
ncbi:CLUMA_CG011568, isoform A [Clunio marinus]|uniref:CLUMA_CG011568, isoform A n=1 Tax=Clunio marinus TaxID=568069 RepID=A0A1J1ID57_9DIPT|nr:CLUMA_CG011568, isoform A [Clunio marinus]